MIVIGSEHFKSQKEANQFCSRMLNSYEPGYQVNKEDSAFLEALLERHHEYKEKLGIGLDHFEVMANSHGTICFRIVRPDGTGTSFSYVTCVAGKAPPKKTDVSNAFRDVIQEDIAIHRQKLFKEYGDATGRIPCAETGKLLLPYEGHMDHRPPMTFEVLVITFLAGQGMTCDDVPLAPPADDQKITCTDPVLVAKWQEFHQRAATIDFVEKHLNLSQASKHRIKKVRCC